MKAFWTVCLPSVLALSAARADTTMWGQGTVTNVIDGNRVHVQSRDRTLKLKLTGMRAPDLEEPGGVSAKAALTELTRDRKLHFVVHSEPRDGDYFFAWLVSAETNGIINLRMVRGGFARTDAIRVQAPPVHLRIGITNSMAVALQEAQAAAISAGVGIWNHGTMSGK